MTQLQFAVTGAAAEPFAVVPTLTFGLRITHTGGPDVRGIALRCQVRIEPRRRHYTTSEEERLFELFGEPYRWGETLHSMLWAHLSLVVPGFDREVEVPLALTCTYDFEVAAAKYLSSLEDGEIPLLFLFSGMVFGAGEVGMAMAPIPWTQEASYRLPVRVWGDVMERHFPGTAWIRLRRDAFDALYRFKSRRALPTWEAAVEALLAEAAERTRV
jgi:hypothetical protein